MNRTSMITKLLAALLALLVLSVSLVACADPGDTDTPADTTTNAAGETPSGDTPSGDTPSGDTPSDDTPSSGTPADGTTSPGSTPIAPQYDEYGREIIGAELPDVRYDGQTFTVHTRGNVERYEWLAEDQNGDRLNDAIYTRNTTVEEKYGITLEVIAEGSWSDYAGTTLPKMQASIQAGNGAYDLIAGYSGPFSSMITTGMLYDLNTFEHLAFEKPWWWDNFQEATQVSGANYFGLGALSLSAIYSMTCVLFNPDILEETNSGTDLYQLVLDGKWTWDKMTELSTNALSDLDGNSIYDTADRYGMVYASNNNNTSQYIVGSGEVLSTRDASGNPVISVNQENMSAVIDKLIAMIHENESCYYGGEGDIRKMFIDGKTLFHSSWLYYAQTQFSSQMDKYDILPTPKASESQADYHTWIQSGMHMYSIPVDVKDTEKASILTEAFAAETYASLLPQYYEVVLKNRYFKDEASSMMMDIMYDSVEFDFVRLFDSQIGILSAINTPVSSGNNTFSSLIKGLTRSGETKLATMLDRINKNITG